jgi:hypothetical protein
MTEDDYRHFLQGELLGGQQARVARDGIAVGADQDWICKSELADRSSDPGDLLPTVSPGIIDSRDQPFDRPQLDLDVNAYRNLGYSTFGRQTRL